MKSISKRERDKQRNPWTGRHTKGKMRTSVHVAHAVLDQNKFVERDGSITDLSICLSIYLASIVAGLSDRNHRARESTSFPLAPLLSLLPPPLFFFPLEGPRKHGTRKCTRGRHVNKHGRMARLNSAEPCRSLTRHRRVSGRRSRSLKRGMAAQLGVPTREERREGGGWVGGGGRARMKARLRGGRIGGNGAIKGRS